MRPIGIGVGVVLIVAAFWLWRDTKPKRRALDQEDWIVRMMFVLGMSIGGFVMLVFILASYLDPSSGANGN